MFSDALTGATGKWQKGRGEEAGYRGTARGNLAGVREALKRPGRVRRSEEEAKEESFLDERTKMQHGH